jgi:hypothetical protein
MEIKFKCCLLFLQIKSAKAGPRLRSGRSEWKSEIKARSGALRANIAQCLRLYIRAARPEAGPCHLDLRACASAHLRVSRSLYTARRQ